MARYLTICQNRLTYDLGRLCGAKKTEEHWGKKTLAGKYLFIEGETWSSVHLRVFDGLMLRAAETDSERVFLETADFAELCGVSPSTMRRQMRQTCALLNLVFTAPAVPLFRCEMKYGGMDVTFLPPFLRAAEGRKGRGVMPFPADLFGVDLKKFPNAYFFGRTLAMHKFMNLGKSNEDVCRIEALPPFGNYESRQGSWRKQFLRPFLGNMEALKDILDYDWEGDMPQNFRRFCRAQIRIIWKDYPYDDVYISRRRERHDNENVH